MNRALIYYSRTGNNRALARVLSDLLGARSEEVRPRGRYHLLRFALDLVRHHRPRVHPPAMRIEGAELLVVVAPVWGNEVALPMQAALLALKGRIGRYAFVTLCGMGRADQAAKLGAQLTELVGHPPESIHQIPARDLVPEARRDDVRAVSAFRLDAAALARVAPRIEAIASAL